MRYSEDIGNKLNDILEKTYDAEKGYKDAADRVDNPRLKSWFTEKAQERYDFGHQLKAEIQSYGETPDKGGSVTGTLHRTWLNIKSVFGDTEERVIEEAIRGEKSSIEEYDEVLTETTLPDSTRTLLRNQRNQIQTGLTKLEQLEAIHD